MWRCSESRRCNLLGACSSSKIKIRPSTSAQTFSESCSGTVCSQSYFKRSFMVESPKVDFCFWSSFCMFQLGWQETSRGLTISSAALAALL